MCRSSIQSEWKTITPSQISTAPMLPESPDPHHPPPRPMRLQAPRHPGLRLRRRRTYQHRSHSATLPSTRSVFQRCLQNVYMFCSKGLNSAVVSKIQRSYPSSYGAERTWALCSFPQGRSVAFVEQPCAFAGRVLQGSDWTIIDLVSFHDVAVISWFAINADRLSPEQKLWELLVVIVYGDFALNARIDWDQTPIGAKWLLLPIMERFLISGTWKHTRVSSLTWARRGIVHAPDEVHRARVHGKQHGFVCTLLVRLV